MLTITAIADIIIYAVVADILIATAATSKKAGRITFTVIALMAVVMAVLKFGIFVGWWA